MTRTAKRSPEELRAEAARLHESIATQAAAFKDTETWTEFLRYCSQFHAYSINNMMLIFSQMPHASRVAGYRKWQELGRQVRKGERGMKIFGHATKKIEDDNGEERSVTFFPMVTVFDISQTDPAGPGLGEPVELTPLLRGEDPHGIAEATLDHLRAQGWTTTTAPLPEGIRGMTDYTTRTVTLSPDLPPAQRAKTAVHEAAHVLLHGPGNQDETRAHRGTIEIEAESTAFVVCNMLGLDSAAYSVPYVASWSGADADTIRATAARVIEAARTLHDSINTHAPALTAPQLATAA